MREHPRHGWQWTRTYARDGTARYTVPRRDSWDVRCEEAPCQRIAGRMTPKFARRRARWRAGGVPGRFM